MDLTIVGSGTVVPEGDRVCASYYVEAGSTRLLLDCGPGASHHMARFDVPWARLTHVAITHFHTDHVGGLPILLFALKHGLRPARTEPLHVIGPIGTRGLFERLADAFGAYMLDPGFPLRIQELESGGEYDLRGARLRAHASAHTPEAVSYRLQSDDATFGYTGDTGPDSSLAAWLEGVDTLLCECSVPDAEAMPIHLTPSSVAALARTVRPGRLVVTHVYPQLDRRRIPEWLRDAGWEGETVVAEDGLRLALRGPA